MLRQSQGAIMRRREFITLLGGAAAGWPFAARAQQPERTRRIGVLTNVAADDPEGQARVAAFQRGLQELGWSIGRNVRMDIRWGAANINRASSLAKELVTLQPDLILSQGTPLTAALQRETMTIPIVFVSVSDPVGSGFVKSLASPEGNITGFINFESSLMEKWLELLKEIAPRITQVTVMFNPQTAPYAEYYLQIFNTAAAKFGVKPVRSLVRSEMDIEQVISELGRESGSGLIAMSDTFMTVHRKSIIELTTRHKVPLMYYFSNGPREGGLISYGVDIDDLFWRATTYVDRILRGTKPAELPVQVPTKYLLAINLKTAKALGLDVPQSILLRANEVIE
jgi:putative ABC transport system substrate-binding protein